jgi:hypothetical protein
MLASWTWQPGLSPLYLKPRDQVRTALRLSMPYSRQTSKNSLWSRKEQMENFSSLDDSIQVPCDSAQRCSQVQIKTRGESLQRNQHVTYRGSVQGTSASSVTSPPSEPIVRKDEKEPAPDFNPEKGSTTLLGGSRGSQMCPGPPCHQQLLSCLTSIIPRSDADVKQLTGRTNF